MVTKGYRKGVYERVTKGIRGGNGRGAICWKDSYQGMPFRRAGLAGAIIWR